MRGYIRQAKETRAGPLLLQWLPGARFDRQFNGSYLYLLFVKTIWVGNERLVEERVTAGKTPTPLITSFTTSFSPA